jgi:hypothetical protein
MTQTSIRWWSAGVVVLALAVGGRNISAAGGAEETEVRERFKQLQNAILAKDPPRIWSMISSKTQDAASKVAKGIQQKYAKADAAGKDKLEKAVGLSKDSLAKMAGPDYFKTLYAIEKYGELADPKTKIEKVVVKGDKATVHYIEPDNDKVTLVFVRQDKEWKAELKIGNVD